ncbi:MAG TPA: Sua5/YciO/YrdC/YwlC family protein [Tepidisphaeraceae bacterium]|nr:Sua5/YciO/YrdC/YwlC family protein [Tepidisphaeraceae bacterium]
MPEVVPIFDVPDFAMQIARGVRILSEGGVAVLPTETVYGAAALLSNKQGNSRLREMRDSVEVKPFTVHLAHPQDAIQYLGEITDLGKRLMQKLWPGPVALVFDVAGERQKQVADELKTPLADLYEGSQITLRCPDHVVSTEVLSRVEGPVGMTVAPPNRWNELNGKVDIIFDSGPSAHAKPSTIVRVLPERYEIVREGVYDQRIIERLLRTTILFVCSGNTCRSPMAEALARNLIAEKLGVAEEDLEKKKGIIVLSAGSFAMPGARAAAPAIEALKPQGMDLTRHRSRTLGVELIHQADWIFTMSRSHAAAVTSLVPSAAGKTAPLNSEGDIEDPIGGDVALYQSLSRQLRELIDQNVVPRVTTG